LTFLLAFAIVLVQNLASPRIEQITARVRELFTRGPWLNFLKAMEKIFKGDQK
jgi:hypothetical protein